MIKGKRKKKEADKVRSVRQKRIEITQCSCLLTVWPLAPPAVNASPHVRVVHWAAAAMPTTEARVNILIILNVYFERMYGYKS